MGRPTMLNNCFGLSTIVHGVEVFPIKIVEWREFESLASKFLLYGEKFLKYKIKAPKDVKIFDFIISLISNEILTSENGQSEMVLEFERLFELVLHKKVTLSFKERTKEWLLLFDGGEVNRHNYDDFRKTIMEMNLIYEPLVAPNELSQKLLDDAIKDMSKGGDKADLEAMIVYVCTYMGIEQKTFEKMTYYQLRAHYEMAQRIQISDAIHLYRAQGAKVDTINMAKELAIHDNPFSFDKLVRKVDTNKEQQQKKALGG